MKNLSKKLAVTFVMAFLILSCENEQDLNEDNSLSYEERMNNLNKLNKSFIDLSNLSKTK